MNGNEQKLHSDTLSVLELWTRIHQQRSAEVYDPEAVVQLFDLLEQTQRRRNISVQENGNLLDQISRLKRQNEKYETALDQSNETIRQLRADLAAKSSKIDSLRTELQEHQRVFQAANNELQSAVGLQCVDQRIRSETSRRYDRSTQKGKRRSSSPTMMSSVAGPSKRSRHIAERINEEQQQDDECTESEGDQQRQRSRPSKLVLGRRAMNRSMSESNVYEPPVGAQQQHQIKAPLSAKHISIVDMRFSPRACLGRGWTKGRPVNQCMHNYVPISNLFSAAFSYCSVCARGLGMKGFRCNDCKLQLHDYCRNHAPMPCVSIVPTPQRCHSRQRPTLGDLAPVLPPRIPGQIIRCVFALEQGFIGTVGLYRVPGCDSEVKKLKEQFNSKYVPKLDQIDPETITGFIKKFLRDLREPLIPFSSYKEFLKAAAEGNEVQLKTSIEELPEPNRDTLAFLCAHWQKVAMHSNENQMPLENLAKVLGPTVVGTTSKLLTLQDKQQQQATAYFMEASRQIQILQALLNLDRAYWTEMYDGPANLNGDEELKSKQQWPSTPTSSRSGREGGHLVQSIVR
uniref:Uncharacterized protein n=1 Tax=Globodera rostochiensis TaxID=31243 RepID=A0A914I6T4_GLORO